MSVISELREQIRECQKKIDDIQEECQHPKSCLVVSHGSDTGNYDPTQDCSYTNYHCKLCEKKWIEHDE